MKIDLVVVIGIVGTICSISFAYIGFLRGVKSESNKSGFDEGKFQSDIAYIKNRTDDVLLEQRETNKSITALSERVTRVEESTKHAHKRLDDLKQKNGSDCHKRSLQKE